MNKENSASRILELLRKANEQPENVKVFKVWSDVFEIDEKEQNRKNMEITRCLSLLHDEIDSVIEGLKLAEEDEFKCHSLLNSIFPILAVHALMGDWKGLKPKLTRELFLCLGYCREVLPTEEDVVNIEDVEELHKLIVILKEQLVDSSLPIYTKKLIQNHINGILKALHNYKIQGASSLQGAMNTIVGEIVSNEETFKDAKDTPEISMLGKILKKVHKVTDGAIKTEKLLSSGDKLANYGVKALEVIEALV
jgi:hypothetical protein